MAKLVPRPYRDPIMMYSVLFSFVIPEGDLLLFF
jgi:hypothetical protein